ncbi:MAG TPA: PP2C family protein-serine/threonine phosphatase [Thermoanaerobaculia bacterium]|nr:PP2C family protein-serine/threonine phosphatase [Thermoanaerobaculia bacterium]
MSAVLQTAVAGPDVHAISIPARTFTGDFWFTRQTDDRLWFALGDVAGKGLPAALVMAMIQEELEQRIHSCARAGCDPAVTMQRLHGFLRPLLPRNRFATAAIGWLRDDGLLTLVNGGHCPPLVLRADGTIEEIDSTGPVVGVLDQSRWSTATLMLDEGDKLLLYSDGVVEAESPDGDEFGRVGIEHALPPTPAPAGAVAASIVDAVRRHAAGARADDLTVLVIGR